MKYYELVYFQPIDGKRTIVKSEIYKYKIIAQVVMYLANIYLKSRMFKSSVGMKTHFTANYFRRSNAIHPTAIIGPNVSMGINNTIGAGVILENCDLGDNNTILAYAIIKNASIGYDNIIGNHTSIGTNGEMRNTKEFNGTVTIGDKNVISEFVSIQRPAAKNSYTVMLSNNLIMAHSHIGHDAMIGDNCEICTGTILGGYSNIMNGAKLKLGVTIRNRKTIGENALIGLGSSVVKDVPAGETWFGNPAKKHEKQDKIAVMAEDNGKDPYLNNIKVETWADLKSVVNSLTDEQLMGKIFCDIGENVPIETVTSAYIMKVDHVNPSGEGAEPISIYQEGGSGYDPDIDISNEPIVHKAGTIFLSCNGK